MATADQIEALVRAHYSRDEGMFKRILLQMSAHAQGNKHTRHAQELRNLSGRGITELVPTNVRNMVKPIVSTRSLDELVLDSKILDKLNFIFKEHSKSDELMREGLRPTSKILLSGPPGTGKTSIALSLASHLNKSLYSIETHSFIEKHLGNSASNLANIFNALENMSDGVFFIDEFDSIGNQRSSGDAASSEMGRVVNTLLQMLDSMLNGILVVATNMYKSLDKAVLRRFDVIIELPMPSDADRRTLIEYNVRGFDPIPAKDMDDLVMLTAGLCHSDIARGCSFAKRQAIITDTRQINVDTLLTIALGQ